MPGDNKILPLIDRRAPILSRIREDETEVDISDDVADLISESVKSNDEESIEEVKEQIQADVRNNLANGLGVNPRNISDSFISELSEMLVDVSEEDVLTNETLEKFGIGDGDTSDDESDTDGDSDLFE